MKNKTLLVLLPILSVALTSCGQVKRWDSHLEDYVFEMGYHAKFNILQLTDIHWNANSSTTASKTYLKKVLEESDKHIKATQGENAHIDLVELTGDMFMLANAYHVNTFVDFFEKEAKEYNFKYTVLWGNHDRHGLYNPNWLSRKFVKAKNCIYLEPNDNLYGRSNFVINLTEGTNVKWQIANLDSGASFSETAVSPFKDYDYIRKDQTQWWVAEHEKVGEAVPAIAYYHIPQDENLDAWNARTTLAKHKFFKLEEFADNGTPEGKSDFIDVAKGHNLKAAFMGHAHNVDWTAEYQGVVIGLGVKTGTELYFAHIDPKTTDEAMKEGLESVKDQLVNFKDKNFDLIGASLVTLNDELGNFDLEHVYLNEKGSGYLADWVKW